MNLYTIKSEDGGYCVYQVVINEKGKVLSTIRVSEPDLFSLSLERLKQFIRVDLGI